MRCGYRRRVGSVVIKHLDYNASAGYTHVGRFGTMHKGRIPRHRHALFLARIITREEIARVGRKDVGVSVSMSWNVALILYGMSRFLQSLQVASEPVTATLSLHHADLNANLIPALRYDPQGEGR